jgi:hypothetical protein
MLTLLAPSWWMPGDGGSERWRPPPGGTGADASEARSTFGPHAIGAQRFVAVSSGAQFVQVTGAILGEQTRVQNPDKEEVPGSSPGRPANLPVGDGMRPSEHSWC